MNGRKPRDGGPSFPLRHRLRRLLWQTVWFVFAAWTPRSLRPWRCFLLRAFGATMGRHADVRGGARVWYPPNLVMEAGAVIAAHVECYNMDTVTLRQGALVSQGAYLCGGTHDYDSADFKLLTKPIVIGRGAWVGARAMVGPGVTIGDGAVLGGGSVTFTDLEAWGVYGGNPAKRIKSREVQSGSAIG